MDLRVKAEIEAGTRFVSNALKRWKKALTQIKGLPSNLETRDMPTNNDGGDVAEKSETSPLINPAPRKQVESLPRLSVWSRLTFQWFTPLLRVGNSKALDFEDMELIPLPSYCTASVIGSKFEAFWTKEIETGEPSLVRALFRAFGADFVRAGFLKLIHDLCIFVGPQVLHALIVFLRSSDAPLWHGIALTAAVTLSQTTMSLCLRHYFFKCYTAGLRVQTAVSLAIYRKALVLSSSERRNRSLGEITNLMAVDTQRLQGLTTFLHAFWSSPLQISIALFFLWQQLGASSLGGVAVIVIMIPVTKFVSQWLGGMQSKLMKARDARSQLNAEVLSGMKVVKFQAWEEPFAKRILDLRERELGHLFRYFVVYSLSESLWILTPLMVSVATFSAYILSGHQLDVASALTALALFEILRFPLFVLPNVINGAVEASVSLHRVRGFLRGSDYTPVGPGNLKDTGIVLEHVTATYDAPGRPRGEAADVERVNSELAMVQVQLESDEHKIRHTTSGVTSGQGDDDIEDTVLVKSLPQICISALNFVCRPGELVAVVGGVGCGKSSLVNAILGEIRILAGTTAVNGSVAFFSQTPFIMNGSIKDNVLFGHLDEPLDVEMYDRALDCCALRHDLRLLPDGDLTEIGEKGITLSGGQKARVALARAVYHRAAISLIDDAFAAVDAHVATKLFEEAIADELLRPLERKNRSAFLRSVVLVTNAIQYLSHPRVTKIVVFQNGEIVEEGSYNSLSSESGSIFCRLLSVLKESGVSEEVVADFSSPRLDDPNITESLGGDNLNVGDEPHRLVTEETRQKGEIDVKMYLVWSHAAGGLFVPVVILFALALVEVCTFASNWWLTFWSEHGTTENQNIFLVTYAIISFLSALLSLLSALLIAFFGNRVSRKMFASLLESVLYAPMSFFDTTPIGRIVNRFSKDMYTVDEELSGTMSTYLSTLFSVVSTVLVVSAVTPMFMMFLLPMIIFYMNEQRFFTRTYRDLKRLDSVSRSPIYALLGETVDGVSVIRAFSAQDSMLGRFTSMISRQQHAYFLTCAAQSWLAVRLELIGTLVIALASLSAVLNHIWWGTTSGFAGLAGLSISYSLSVTQSLNWSVRMASDLEANMVGVERVDEYAKIKPEGDRVTAEDHDLPDLWPTTGEIIFKNARLRYRPNLPLVLKGLDLRIPAGCKLGVVGRTGAGKSTLIVALMRIVELCDGAIYIDKHNTRDVGLATLRRNLAVIPQDPLLFSGTIRSNIDPFDDFTEDELYAALESVGLYKSISSSTHSSSSVGRVDSVDDRVTEGGLNFSLGQRQLIVIARALLRKAKIVIMDEATAAVDAETDASIQKVMRREFSFATCITVAHRLNTIMDSDLILVMDDGRAAEFGKPSELLERGGRFRDLVNASASMLRAG